MSEWQTESVTGPDLAPLKTQKVVDHLFRVNLSTMWWVCLGWCFKQSKCKMKIVAQVQLYQHTFELFLSTYLIFANFIYTPYITLVIKASKRDAKRCKVFTDSTSDCYPNTDSKRYTTSFGIETLEIYISASRYRSEMILYSKRSYGYQFSK